MADEYEKDRRFHQKARRSGGRDERDRNLHRKAGRRVSKLFLQDRRRQQRAFRGPKMGHKRSHLAIIRLKKKKK